jgi:trk system potassium uptake protein TrkA
MAKEKVFAVFGLGVFGTEVSRTLSQKGAKVIAVDVDKKAVEKMKDVVTQAVLLDSTDEEALRNAGLQDADVAIIAMGKNVGVSILTTILLKNLGVPCIIARAMFDLHAQVLRKIGATEVINIEIEQGSRIANRLVTPDIVDMIPVSADQAITELRIPKEFAGKSLHDLELRKKYNVNVISIKRTKTDIDDMGNPKREELVFSPKPMDILNINDILVILGSQGDIEKLKEMEK